MQIDIRDHEKREEEDQIGEVYRFTDRLDEAGATYQRALDLVGRQPLILGRLGELYALQDEPEAAFEIIEELRTLSETRYVRPSIMAGIYLALGAHDTMFTWLERARQERDTALTLLHHYPTYDPVRSDPHFRLLLDEVGFG